MGQRVSTRFQRWPEPKQAGLEHVKRVLKKVLADDHVKQARMGASRASANPEMCKRPRCGHPEETLLHRYRACPDNANIGHKDITNTERLADKANEEHETPSAFWCGGILPKHMCCPRHPRSRQPKPLR